MSDMNFLERLLDGAAVEWKPLEVVAKIKHGKDWKGLVVQKRLKSIARHIVSK